MEATTQMSPEQARNVLEYFLPTIENMHRMTREVIRNFPEDKLDHRFVEEGMSFSDLLWYLNTVYSVFMDGVSDGKFSGLPAKPEQGGIEAYLAWDDEHFGVSLQRITQLSGEELLKPLTFGPATKAAVEHLSFFMGNIQFHLGQLTAGLALLGSVSQQGKADDTLSEEELDSVAGGRGHSLHTVAVHQQTYQNTGPGPAQIQITNQVVHFNPFQQNTQSDLLSLWGGGSNGNHFGLLTSIGGEILGDFMSWGIDFLLVFGLY